MKQGFRIIDISQPVSSATACFPGDVPFSRRVTMSLEDTGPESGVINLSAFTMSPHVGTHADAPVHIQGSFEAPSPSEAMIGELSLSPFVGPALVIDLSPWHEAITWPQVEPHLRAWSELPPRVLFKTQAHNKANLFQPPYAWPAIDLIQSLAERGVVLVGIDTPSVDFIDSKTLESHHALLQAGMVWLENLDLTGVTATSPQAAPPFLVALPLKLMELEASPVRAVLLQY